MTISKRNRKLLIPEFNERLELIEAEFKRRYPDAPEPFMTDGYRTKDEQNELYEQGRSKPGPIVTWVKGGSSMHNYGLAADFAFKTGKPDIYPLDWLIKFGLLAEEYGLVWGIDGALPADRSDKPHVSYPCTIRQANRGFLPKLPPVPNLEPDDEPWLVTFFGDDDSVAFLTLHELDDLVQRTDINGKRIYIRKDKG